ncbi:MogA/MoaB family molybdenum cofactor biosynthesis protein [Micropruina sonneratiae]|uniref:MogA/MoaB family molybdenum cofactor biosynthesis protein n=1 Tax=Micropruina sonneratiae TaxID=2986940 RepID=UPI002227E43E|nr:MogA/MoaB family molybdenum cofactor biosynthesis protein [Micropruina sp. KQZ13P-5]MCW3156680.1 MogA/MoaB family molybdenum cofactor biosynthesis protein [Micropruina sp. KQZ13P-5]
MTITGAVLTVSDRASAGEYTDTSGPLAAELLAGYGVDAPVTVVPDDPAEIRRGIRAAIKAGARVVLTTGGTGIAPRDVTPEVTAELFSRRLPGIADEIRRRGAASVPTAVLSRAEAGIVQLKKWPPAFVVNAPGSTGGVTDTVAVVGPLIAHLLDQLEGGDHAR